jgi:hypothetical protein
MSAPVASEAMRGAGRAAHDLGLAAILGGNLFARVGMHPALAAVSDPRERGRVLNQAWARYGAVNGLGLVAVLAGRSGARAGEASLGTLSGPERTLALVRDGATAVLAGSGLVAAIAGVRFARMEPGGAVPLTDGDEAADAASPAEEKAKRTLNALGTANLVSAIVLATANAARSQVSSRDPPVRSLRRPRG